MCRALSLIYLLSVAVSGLVQGGGERTPFALRGELACLGGLMAPQIDL